MQLLRTFAVVSSLLLTACAQPPVKPAVELCQINIQASVCNCGMTDGERDVDNNLIFVGPSEDKPLEYCDKATAFPPASWEKVQTYIDLLEDYAQNECKKR